MSNTNINPNEGSSLSQCNAIIAYLLEGNAITQLDALEKFRCFRLASRIHDIRQRGYEVEREMIIAPSGKRVAQYKIKQDGRLDKTES